MEKYKKIVVSQLGPAENMVLEEHEVPEPNGDEVLIKVENAGVAFGDIMRRAGIIVKECPVTPGYDVAGRVVTTGSQVSAFKPGDRVTAYALTGGYSQYICLKEYRVVHLPDDIPFEDGAALVLNYITAYQMVYRTAKVTKERTALVQNAAGGVGTALIQLLTAEGLKVYGTASPAKHDLVSQLGAIPIDYKSAPFEETLNKMEPNGVDYVFDSVGFSHFKRSRSVLKKGGHLVGFGAVSRDVTNMLQVIFTVTGLKIFNKGRKFDLYTIDVDSQKEWFQEDMKKLTAFYQAGKIKPVINKIIPLENAPEAHRLLESGENRGKIVLSCN